MDLEKIAKKTGEIDYTNGAKRKYAIEFFSGLSQDKRITPECWEDLIAIGEAAYFTTFTDDSGYIPGGINLSALNKQPHKLRMDLLDYMHRSNYIIKKHVDDYIKNIA